VGSTVIEPKTGFACQHCAVRAGEYEEKMRGLIEMHGATPVSITWSRNFLTMTVQYRLDGTRAQTYEVGRKVVQFGQQALRFKTYGWIRLGQVQFSFDDHNRYDPYRWSR
jgi:hypothetical protein